MLQPFLRNSVQCRLCWRIATYVMLSIVLIEAIILVPSYRNYETDLLGRIEQVGRREMLTLLSTHPEATATELAGVSASLPHESFIRGGAFYGPDGTRLGAFGETPALVDPPRVTKVRSDDGRNYEVYWSAAELKNAYGVAVHFDSAWIGPELNAFLWRVAGLVLLISAVVCATTMAIVGSTVLSPLLRLRANLTTAAGDPANVDRYTLPDIGRDELGDVIAAANALLGRVATSYRDSLQMLTRMVDQAADAIVAHDESGKVVFANRACLEICGFGSAEEMTAASFPRFKFTDKSRVFTVPALEDDASFSREALLIDSKGRETPVLLNAARAAPGTNSPVRYYASITDISVIREAHEEVERQNFELQSANRAKTEFLANMSHELRTPLNAVIGFSEAIKRRMFGPLGNDRYAEYAGDIHASGTHLLRIINDILDLSKIEAGRMELNEETMDLAGVVEDAARIVHERAEAGQIKLMIEAAPKLPDLWADERAIKQILINLMSNAIKFTPPGGTVTVAAECDTGGVVLSVRDTGLGMHQDDIPKALAPFGQVDGSLARRHEGTGLGLPLVQSLTELHGGELAIESAPGEGTAITIRFPPDRTIAETGTRSIA